MLRTSLLAQQRSTQYSSEMRAAFLRDLYTQPATTVAHLRDLLLQPASKEDYSTALDFATEFRDFLHNDTAAEDIIGRSTWNAALSAGLPLIYADVVSAKNFFAQPLVRISIAH